MGKYYLKPLKKDEKERKTYPKCMNGSLITKPDKEEGKYRAAY